MFHGISPIDLPLFCVSIFSEMKFKFAYDSPNHELMMAFPVDRGGFDYEFDPPLSDDPMCSICHLALKIPVQTLCGHKVCRECLSEFHRRWIGNSFKRCLVVSVDNDSLRQDGFVTFEVEQHKFEKKQTATSVVNSLICFHYSYFN